MLLKPEEYARNKLYKKSKLKQKIHGKAQKSLLNVHIKLNELEYTRIKLLPISCSSDLEV
jgi:hypothetical protein